MHVERRQNCESSILYEYEDERITNKTPLSTVIFEANRPIDARDKVFPGVMDSSICLVCASDDWRLPRKSLSPIKAVGVRVHGGSSKPRAHPHLLDYTPDGFINHYDRSAYALGWVRARLSLSDITMLSLMARRSEAP